MNARLPQNLIKSVITIMLTLFFFPAISQTLSYLSTMPPYAGGNGSSMVTFNVKAHNAIRIREMYNSFNSTAAQTTIIWYKTDSINGSPTVSVANGWVQAHTYMHTPALSGYGTMVICSDTSLNLLIPAGATYGFAISSGSVAYSNSTASTPTTPWLISDSNLRINVGANVGYGGTLTGPIASRAFNGKIGYVIVQQQTDAALEALQSPGDSVCSGLQPVVVTMKNNGPSALQNVQIQWKVNNVAQPAHNWSGNLAINATTNATIGSYNFLTGTTYNLMAFAVNPNNVVDTVTFNDTIIRTGVFVKTSPTVLPIDTFYNICSGDTANVYISFTGTSPWHLTLHDGSTTLDFINIMTSLYTVKLSPVTSKVYSIQTVTDATGCSGSYPHSLHVNVNPAPPAVITPVGSTACCAGDSVSLMASVGLNFVYTWKKDGLTIPNASNYVFYAKQGGVYTVIVQSPIGCAATSAPVTITVHPRPAVFIGNDTAVLPATVLQLNAGAGFTSYLWSTGATTPSITVDSAGLGIGVKTIWVKVTDNFGCVGVDTIKINFTPGPGMDEFSQKTNMRIFPNPTDGKFELQLQSFQPGEISIEIYRQDGRNVYRGFHLLDRLDKTVQMDASSLENGIYLLKVIGDQGSITRKLIVSRR